VHEKCGTSGSIIVWCIYIYAECPIRTFHRSRYLKDGGDRAHRNFAKVSKIMIHIPDIYSTVIWRRNRILVMVPGFSDIYRWKNLKDNRQRVLFRTLTIIIYLCFRKYYRLVHHSLYVLAVLTLTYAPLSLHRLGPIIATAFVLIMLHQVVAPALEGNVSREN